MRPLALVALVTLAGCAGPGASDAASRRRADGAARDRSRDGVVAPAPASGVRPAGSTPAPRPTPPAPRERPVVAPEVEAQWPPAADAAVPMPSEGSERLEAPGRRPSPPGPREVADGEDLAPLDEEAAGDPGPPAGWARPPGPWPSPPALEAPLRTDLVADWLRAAEEGEPDDRAEAARGVRGVLDALARELAAVREQLHDLTLARRASEAKLAARAEARDRREQDDLLERHRPPPGVAVYPPDAWKAGYQRDLAALQDVQQRRHATERAVLEAEEARQARPIHARKRDLEALRIRGRVVLRRLEE